jgi:hypothetical protein
MTMELPWPLKTLGRLIEPTSLPRSVKVRRTDGAILAWQHLILPGATRSEQPARTEAVTAREIAVPGIQAVRCGDPKNHSGWIGCLALLPPVEILPQRFVDRLFIRQCAGYVGCEPDKSQSLPIAGRVLTADHAT